MLWKISEDTLEGDTKEIMDGANKQDSRKKRLREISG